MLLMPHLEFLHGLGFIEQSERDTTQEVLQIEYTFVRKDFANGIRRLSTFMQPLERFLTIDLDGAGYGQRIVGTDLLDELAIPGGTGVSHYNKVEGPFFTPVALQTNLDSHKK